MKINEMRRQKLPIVKKLGKPVVVQGKSGIGKTEGIGAFAMDEDCPHLLVKVSQMGELEFKGLPDYQQHETLGKVSVFVPGAIIAAAWDLYKQTGKGPHLTFDEMGNARGPVQVALYEALESGSIGGHRFPPNTFIAATTNRLEDHAYTFKLAAPLVNRAIFVDVECELEDWLGWGLSEAKPELRPEVLGFMRFTNGEHLHGFNPKTFGTPTGGYPFATPRSWKAVSDLLHLVDGALEGELIAGCVGSGVTGKFLGFVKDYQELPTMEEILREPKEARVPKREKPSACYAVAAALVLAGKDETFKPLMEYTERLPSDFQVMIVKDFVKRIPSFSSKKEFTKWCVKNGNLML